MTFTNKHHFPCMANRLASSIVRYVLKISRTYSGVPTQEEDGCYMTQLLVCQPATKTLSTQSLQLLRFI